MIALLLFAATLDCSADSIASRAPRAVAEGIVAADNKRDIERVLAFYAPDATLMPPSETPVIGRERIRPRYEALFTGFDPAIEGRIDEICVSGDVAYVRGHNGGILRGRNGTPSRSLNDVYLMILRKDANGAWLISHLMWHSGSRAPLDTDSPPQTRRSERSG